MRQRCHCRELRQTGAALQRAKVYRHNRRHLKTLRIAFPQEPQDSAIGRRICLRSCCAPDRLFALVQSLLPVSMLTARQTVLPLSFYAPSPKFSLLSIVPVFDVIVSPVSEAYAEPQVVVGLCVRYEVAGGWYENKTSKMSLSCHSEARRGIPTFSVVLWVGMLRLRTSSLCDLVLRSA